MIYNFSYVKENKDIFVNDSLTGLSRFNTVFGEENISTNYYQYYNAFGLTSGSTVFFELYKKLNQLIKEYNQKDERLWMQAWFNFHPMELLLPWHNHVDSSFHGYVSIEPHNTITEFKDKKIKNEVGNIYIGPSYEEHRVVAVEPFKTMRITLAFDVFKEQDLDGNKELMNIGIIPLI